MTTAIIHLSDFHCVKGQNESHAAVAKALFSDLRTQLDQTGAKNTYLAFSGDIAYSADDVEQYEHFMLTFDEELSKIGIPKERRICVPGNHDLSHQTIKSNIVIHEGVVSQDLGELDFNDFVLQAPNILTSKFDNYMSFQTGFARYGLAEGKVSGAGWSLTDDIGLYCLNTALCSSGGLAKDGKTLVDCRRLRIDTRSLHSWIQQSSARWKILVMHHPLHWLEESSERELRVLLKNNFALRLYGHEHEQEVLHSIGHDKSIVECCAPALFTKKADQLGYSIVTIDNKLGVRDVAYRQWTSQHSFVTGTSFSNTDSGKVSFHINYLDQLQPASVHNQDFVGRYFSKRLDEALISFAGQPLVWVDPVIKTTPEGDREKDSTPSVDLTKFIMNPVSSLIRAFPQFGLTCLALHLVKDAWAKRGDLWLYLDAIELKPNLDSVKQATARQLVELGLSHTEIKCVVLDSVATTTKDAWKILARVHANFPGLPLICMQTLDPGLIHGQPSGHPDPSVQFQLFYLWTLPRTLIRGIVVEYNENRLVGDEDLVITRIVADLEMLNLHRTPLNCLTLLKVSESDFDESPVNRSEMIKRILFLLFNADPLPTYKARPDLKDCEYVLGYFCELMLRSNEYTFSRSNFLSVLQQYCRDRFIDLEVHVVFDILSANHILVGREGQFAFKFAFWVYYFAAMRMHHDKNFLDFMLSDMRYAHHPELLEFYTGIDRQREDALRVLTRDLTTCRDAVDNKCGFPKGMDPYRLAQWIPSPEALKKMQTELEVGVQGSNLPSEIKDRFADQDYDPKRPYDQRINMLSDHALIYLMHTLRAAAKALRNSDYVDPLVKRALLEEILRCWEQLTIVLLVLLPVLADKGYVVYDGAGFMLDGDFGPTVQDRIQKILSVIPMNVVKWSRDDLFSQRMGPLIVDVFTNEKGQLRKHELSLLLVTNRPRGWSSAIHSYIASIHKNSFYLLDINRALRNQYRYSYVTNATLKDIEGLIQMSLTKHLTGVRDPGIKLIAKTIPFISGEPVVPPREV